MNYRIKLVSNQDSYEITLEKISYSVYRYTQLEEYLGGQHRTINEFSNPFTAMDSLHQFVGMLIIERGFKIVELDNGK